MVAEQVPAEVQTTLGITGSVLRRANDINGKSFSRLAYKCLPWDGFIL